MAYHLENKKEIFNTLLAERVPEFDVIKDKIDQTKKKYLINF